MSLMKPRRSLRTWQYVKTNVICGICFALLLGTSFWLLAVGAENDRRARQGIEINKAQFGRAWPFTVSRGYLRCVGTGVIVFASGGREYAVNGDAETAGYAPIEAIGKIRNVPGEARINLLPIIDRGLELCKGRSENHF
jgi:hypothetical protein